MEILHFHSLQPTIFAKCGTLQVLMQHRWKTSQESVAGFGVKMELPSPQGVELFGCQHNIFRKLHTNL